MKASSIMPVPPFPWLYRAMLLALLLAGCATPQSRMPTVESAAALAEADKQHQMVVEDYMNANTRLQTVASKVVTSGTALCGEKVGPYYGLSVWNQYNFSPDWKDTVQTHFGLGDPVQVSVVAAGSAADLAGFKPGDTVLSINNWIPPAGKEGPDKVMEKLQQEGKFWEPVQITVLRAGQEHQLAVTPVNACAFRVKLSPEDVKNAYADGSNIIIYKGMVDFCRTDEELALVVSHELAHNSMKHIDAQKSNATVGGLVGLILDVAAAFGGVNTNGDFSRLGSNIAAGMYSVSFEQEADYVGLYFMATAGYNIDNSAAFWRRMATSDSKAITMKSSHPTTPERFLAIESATREIKAKQSAGQPLKPEMKNAEAPPATRNPKAGVQPPP